MLTNYRETDTHDANNPVQGTRSRGGMVTAWLTGPEEESTQDFVYRLLKGDGVKGVGGFSLVCGKLRKRGDSGQELEPMAIISNRAGNPDEVPWIAERRGEVYGLSNTSYEDPETWPKVKLGKEKLLEAVEEVVAADSGEEELVDKLFAVLDTNTLPEQEGQEFEQYIPELRRSIFIPGIGKKAAPSELPRADEIAAAKPLSNGHARTNGEFEEALKEAERPERMPNTSDGNTGIYGTQRQSIVLVDWEGHVTFIERSLWDAEGQTIQRGHGDMKFEFKIEGWNG